MYCKEIQKPFKVIYIVKWGFKDFNYKERDIMKRFFLFLSINCFFIFSAATSYAFNPEDLSRLIKDKECVSGAFSSCDLEGAVLKNLDLRGAKLEGANLKGAIIENTDLTGAVLEEADLSQTKIRFSKFTKAIMQSVNLDQSTVLFSEFNITDLTDAQMTDMTIKGVKFRGANFSDVDLKGSDLKFSDLTGVFGIKEEGRCRTKSFGKCL